MSHTTDLPQAAIDFVIGLLLPILLPALAGDAETARAIATRTLAEYEPRSMRELQLAGEAAGFSLKTLVLLAQSSDPAMPAERQEGLMKLATALSRSGQSAQRKLELLRRARRAASANEPAPDATPSPVEMRVDAAADLEIAESYVQPPEQPADAPAEPAPSPDLAQAELAYHAAAAQLTLMKARFKGAPPPHSQAAQQIKAQQRIVDMARLKLDQARRRPVPAVQAAAA
ncbi:MAG: hypothetical protein U1E70_20955 [Acetobacteraceae bacterium]|nr:hypothetical protein [Pseudomonadota bacterium]